MNAPITETPNDIRECIIPDCDEPVDVHLNYLLGLTGHDAEMCGECEAFTRPRTA